MNLKKILPYVLVFAVFAVPVLAAPNAGLQLFGDTLKTIFGGIFNAISTDPALWMKVILTICMFCVLYAGLHKQQWLAAKPGALTMLSIVLAIAMVAPLPERIITNVFGFSGVLAAAVFLIPILLLMYFSHTLTKTEKGEEERWRYITALVLWVVAWFYIGGVGNALAGFEQGAAVEGAQLIAALVSIFYIIANVIRAIGIARSGASEATDYLHYGKSTPTPADVTDYKKNRADLDQAKLKPATTLITEAKNVITKAKPVMSDIRNICATIHTAIIGHQHKPYADANRRFEHAFAGLQPLLLRVEGLLTSLTQNTQVLDQLAAQNNRAVTGTPQLTKWYQRQKRDESMLQQTKKQVDQDIAEVARVIQTLRTHGTPDFPALQTRFEHMTDFYSANGLGLTTLKTIESDL